MSVSDIGQLPPYMKLRTDTQSAGSHIRRGLRSSQLGFRWKSSLCGHRFFPSEHHLENSATYTRPTHSPSHYCSYVLFLLLRHRIPSLTHLAPVPSPDVSKVSPGPEDRWYARIIGAGVANWRATTCPDPLAKTSIGPNLSTQPLN